MATLPGEVARVSGDVAERARDPLGTLVETSAAPSSVGPALDRLVGSRPGLADRLVSDPGLAGAVVTTMAASPALARVLLRRDDALDALADLERPVPTSPPHGELHRWYELELLRLAARDLIGIDRLDEVMAGLSRLAAAVLEAALAAAGADGVAVIGMGKLAGAELNYSSDVDLMVVCELEGFDQRPLRRALELARQCFRVDLALRPEGRAGPIVRSLDSYRAYWQRWAEPWEFQALLRSHPVAGDAKLGASFAAAASDAIWQRPWGADEIRQVRTLKARNEAEVRRKGLTDREIKQGPGGIRDVEFAVQLLQLVHGRYDTELRTPSTLGALAVLGRGGYVALPDADELAGDYRFLRTVEHRLQLVELAQVHTVPADPGARETLAKVLGYPDDGGSSARGRFDDDLRERRARARRLHELLWFRPLLDAFAALPAPDAWAPRLVSDRLGALGFRDAEGTRHALQELTGGLTRSSRLMRQMLPLLLDWLVDSPDPDLGLLGLRRLSDTPHRRDRLIEQCRDSPEAARRCCLVLGTSRLLTDTLVSEPDLLSELDDDAALGPHLRRELVAQGQLAMAVRPETRRQGRALQRLRRRETLRIAVRDLLDQANTAATGSALATLAEAIIEAALAGLRADLPLAVVAVGRFGGSELSYASDLDLLLVAGGETGADLRGAEDVGESFLGLLRGETAAASVYPVDLSLRPEGRHGPVVRSLGAYRAYFERWAQTWERQALLRARPVAGDTATASAFGELVEEFVWGRPFGDDEIRDIRRMKARIERERIPPGEDPAFHLKLGRGSLSDVEWTVQLLQLQAGVRSPGTLAALDELVEAGVVSTRDGQVLADAYRWCEQARNRLYLLRGRPQDALPTRSDELARLARSLDRTPTKMREEYRRVTRRARQVMEERFYGLRVGSRSDS